MTDQVSSPVAQKAGNAREVLYAFLRLGCISFGGPIAHLGYFHTEFVERRKWCDEETFAELIGLAQSMPGPTSSQVGFALGLLRAGWRGGLAAWAGFTLPSALLMLAFAFGHGLLTGKIGLGIVHGLQLVAVAVVAQAILAMRKSLASDVPRIVLAIVAAVTAFLSNTVIAICVGAIGGLLLRAKRKESIRTFKLGAPKLTGLIAASVFLLLLLVQPIVDSHDLAHGIVRQSLDVFGAFYRTGALVFGGGHVVLPLLENGIVSRGWVSQQSFLTGYGAAQALPGPLFTFSAYLGATIKPTANPFVFSALALVAIFIPGLLILVAALPYWNRLYRVPKMRSVLHGVNAAVVGVLVAAFIRPVWTTAVHGFWDVAVALVAFALLVRWKVAPWIVVVSVASASIVGSLLF